MISPRLTIRRMMAVVAFLAILFWVGLVVSRWTEYRCRTMQLTEQRLVLTVESFYFDKRLQAIPPKNIAARKQFESSIAEHRQATIKTEILLARYRKAMRRPWLRVEPDSTVEEKYYP
jgi:hypothetical protein